MILCQSPRRGPQHAAKRLRKVHVRVLALLCGRINRAGEATVPFLFSFVFAVSLCVSTVDGHFIRYACSIAQAANQAEATQWTRRRQKRAHRCQRSEWTGLASDLLGWPLKGNSNSNNYWLPPRTFRIKSLHLESLYELLCIFNWRKRWIQTDEMCRLSQWIMRCSHNFTCWKCWKCYTHLLWQQQHARHTDYVARIPSKSLSQGLR